MKKYWRIPFLVLILGGFYAASNHYLLEGSMVFSFGVDVNEYWDSDNPNGVTLQLMCAIGGINEESPHYNCGLSQRVGAITLEVPEQELVNRSEVNWEMGVSNLSSEYPAPGVQWYPFLLVWLINFSLMLDPGDTEVRFIFEFETDTIDPEQTYPDIITVTDSVSFTHLIHLNETNTSTSTMTTTATTSIMRLDSLPLILGTGVGIIAVAAGFIFLKRRG